MFCDNEVSEILDLEKDQSSSKSEFEAERLSVQSAAELKVQKSEFRKNRKILQIFYLS
jgi:hypothetical protein